MDDGIKPPPERGKKKPFRVIKTGESVLAQPSVETVKQLFMASKNLEWIPFAQSQGWDPISTRKMFPVSEWITQKKETLAREQAERIAELVFDHRSRWHHDVLKTLREYPEAADAALGIIKHRENEFINMINADMEEKQKAHIEKREPNLKFSKVKTSELVGLAMALKTVTETKHRSLLINDWSVKIAEQFTDPKQFELEEMKMKDNSWRLEVIGGENLTSEQMQEFLAKWYDKPPQAHTVEQIAPQQPEEPEPNPEEEV